MKQLLQDLKTGQVIVADCPAPRGGCQSVLVRTRRSLISAGTERMLVEFGRSGLIGKARSQPDKVRQVVDKIRTDGLLPTVDAVLRKLEEPLPLGYCNVGEVIETGAEVTDLQPGDRVACNGPHAEIVCVGRRLCAKVPETLGDDQAAFTVVGAIGLQGLRLLEPTFGERMVVYGLGLIGLLCVQMLRASGCEVLGVDVDENRLATARRFGAETVDARRADPTAAAEAFSRGEGVDGVLITASARTDEIVRNAAEMCRKRGRIVLVGVVGLNLNRDLFYKKELRFQVSCSYGPGRYDDAYERGGRDYPLPYVRWTEERNLQAVLDALAAGRIRVEPLISHRYPLAEAPEAYRTLTQEAGALAVVLEYPRAASPSRSIELGTPKTTGSEAARVAVIGTGAFARAQLLPALRRTPAELTHVVSAGGISAQSAARRFGARIASTDAASVLADPAVDAVVIATRHDSHATLVCGALEAGKHVFVEKPLALSVEELSEILAAAQSRADRQLMVGFNRRFSPHTRRIRDLICNRSGPLCMSMTVNAGAIPADHWIHDPKLGGGRIIGEGCHFIDLLAYLAGAPVETVSAVSARGAGDRPTDSMTIQLGFADGSTAAVNYFTAGSKAYPKETLEIHCERRTLRLDNFRRLRGWGIPGFGRFRTLRQDKGHREEMAQFVRRVAEGGRPLIGLEELVNTTLASFAAARSAAARRTVDLAELYAELRRERPERTRGEGGQILAEASWAPTAGSPGATRGETPASQVLVEAAWSPAGHLGEPTAPGDGDAGGEEPSLRRSA